jgi:fatty-acid peroxygenase
MRRRSFDSTAAFLRDGYVFASSRFDTWGTDLFTTRLLLQPTTFIRGEEAAGLFYDDDRFTREAAMPPTVQHLLQDKGSVQALDGEDHRLRKAAFLSLMHADAMSRLGEMFAEEWTGMLEAMPGPRRIVLHGFAREVLTRTACRWAGVPAGVTDARVSAANSE